MDTQSKSNFILLVTILISFAWFTMGLLVGIYMGKKIHKELVPVIYPDERKNPGSIELG